MLYLSFCFQGNHFIYLYSLTTVPQLEDQLSGKLDIKEGTGVKWGSNKKIINTENLHDTGNSILCMDGGDFELFLS